MIRTLIIEDERAAAERLERLLLKTEPEIEVIGFLDSVESSIEWLNHNSSPDLIMLDIQLADGQSFEIFRQVKIDSFVIFTTAYDEFAIRAFELNSIDYLLKPINEAKLAKGLLKLKKIRSRQSNINFEELLRDLESRKSMWKKRFLVNAGSRIRSVGIHEVAYFYSLEKGTFLCTTENKHYLIEFSLDKLGNMLEPDNFFHINRQFIINFSSIAKIHLLSKSRIKVELQPPTSGELLVSTSRTHEFRLWLDR
jgi:DNA-binding LytR/AlgR family response regulator